MSAEGNKEISRRLIEEVFTGGNLELADEMMTVDAVTHDPQSPVLPSGPEGTKQVVSTYRSAFPDLRFTVEDVFGEGDRVALRWTASGTHRGDLPDIPATGRESTVSGITIDRFENDRIAESWTNWDTLGMLQNLGVVPAPQQE